MLAWHKQFSDPTTDQPSSGGQAIDTAPQIKQSRQAAPTPTVKGHCGGLTARGSITHAHTHVQILRQHNTPACAFRRHESRRIQTAVPHHPADSIDSQPAPSHRPRCHTLHFTPFMPHMRAARDMPSKIDLAAQQSGPHHKTRPASHPRTRQFTPLPPEKHTCTHTRFFCPAKASQSSVSTSFAAAKSGCRWRYRWNRSARLA